MRTTLIGIVLFLAQLGLAIFYSQTIDLVVIAIIAVITFIYVLNKYRKKEYDHCEI